MRCNDRPVIPYLARWTILLAFLVGYTSGSIVQAQTLSIDLIYTQNPTVPCGTDGGFLAEVHGGTPPYIYELRNKQELTYRTVYNQDTSLYNDNLYAGIYLLKVSDASATYLELEFHIFDPAYPGNADQMLICLDQVNPPSAPCLKDGSISGFFRNTTPVFDVIQIGPGFSIDTIIYQGNLDTSIATAKGYSFITISRAEGSHFIKVTDSEGSNIQESIELIAAEVSEHPDYQALMDFYYSLDGPNWEFQENWGKNCVCMWEGISCNENGRVSGISMHNGGLVGIKPTKRNILKGEIPASIGDLEELEVLNLMPLVGILSYGLEPNQITGVLPASIGNLQKLKILYISGSDYSSLPQSVTQVPLEYLDISHCAFSGNYPEIISDIITLKRLYIFNNQFDGFLPESIANLSEIEVVAFDNNKFSGCIPSSYSILCGKSISFTGNHCLTHDYLSDWCSDPVCFFDDYSISDTKTICSGESVTLYANGGNAYSWNTGATTDQIEVSPEITTWYYMELTTPEGCVRSDSVMVKVLPPIKIELIEQIDESEPGAADGRAGIEVSGGNGFYKISWRNENDVLISSSFDAENLTAGSYQIAVVDSFCMATFTFEIGVTCALSSEITIENQVSCWGYSDGQLSVLTTGSNGTVSYLWSNGSSQESIDQLSAGAYTLTVTDGYGCFEEISTYLSQPDDWFVYEEITSISKHLARDGQIELLVGGSTPPYDFQWSNGDIEQHIDGLEPGSYSVTITDANGCTTEKGYVVEDVPCNIAVKEIKIRNTPCYNRSGGRAEVIMSDGQNPFLYQWSHDPELVGSVAEQLGAGGYNVTVTDLNGCFVVSEIYIEQPSRIAIDVIVEGTSNPEKNNGSATAIVSGGVPPYQIFWPNGDSGVATSNLSAGNYEVLVVDSNGCEKERNFQIQEGSSLCQGKVNIEVVHDISCFGSNDGILQLHIDTSLTSYTISWSTGDTGLVIENLKSGEYTVSVTDESGCEVNRALKLSDPEPLQLEFQTVNASDSLHIDGQIQLTVKGGSEPYFYFIDDLATNSLISGLSAGLYPVRIEDAKGCILVDSILIETKSCNLVIDTIETKPVACFGVFDGRAKVILKEPVIDGEYLWDDSIPGNSNFIDGLDAGVHTVQITYGNCDQKEIFTIPSPEELKVDIQVRNASESHINDGAIELKIQGGTGVYQVYWVHGDSGAILNNLETGIYRCQIIDENACQIDTSISIGVMEPCQIKVSLNLTNIDCTSETGSAEVVQEGLEDFTFSWLDIYLNPVDPRILIPGDYQLVVTTPDSTCSTSIPFTILDQSLVTSCTLTQDYHSGSNNRGEITITIDGTDSIYTLLLFVDSSLVAEHKAGSGETVISGLGPGAYEIRVIGNHCQQSCNQLIVDQSCILNQAGWLESIQIETSPPDGCLGENGLIRVVGESSLEGLQISFDGGKSFSDNTEKGGLSEGEYLIYLRKTSSNCLTLLDTIRLAPDSLEPTINIQVQEQVPPSCPGGQDGYIRIAVQGGEAPYNITWSDESKGALISGLGEGQAMVKVSDQNGCISIKSFDLQVKDSFNLRWNWPDKITLCHGETFPIRLADSLFSYQWKKDGVFISADQKIEIYSEGTFTLEAIRHDGCSINKQIILDYHEEVFHPAFLLPSAIVVDSMVVAVESSWPIPDSIEWILPAGVILVGKHLNQIQLQFQEVGKYTIQMLAGEGECMSVVEKNIQVFATADELEALPAPVNSGIQNMKLFPNPNHGIFQVSVQLGSVQEVQLRIYNESGDLIDIQVLPPTNEIDYSYNLPGLSAGYYTLVAQTATSWKQLTFVVQN